ncbi:MAG: M20/M25/M40 family metallo-hydrolase [Ignavibacteriaceae bacterium]
MRSLLYISIAALITISVSAQTGNSVLISIDLNSTSDLNKIEMLNIPVIHQFENVLICRIDSHELNMLDQYDITLTIIDNNADDSEYFIVKPRKDFTQGISVNNENVIFRHNSEIIVKNISSVNKLISDGYNVTSLDGSSVYFKNEKMFLLNPVSQIDTTIYNIISQVNADSVEYFIQSLQDFQTRFLFANTRDSVAKWIKSEFIRFGFTDVVLDSFEYQGTWQMNVVATLQGTVLPENYFVFGGHHDSYSSGDPYTFAPGADDNASGTSAVLEIARVIMQSGYQPKSTLKFVTFAAEEYGLWGSKHYAENALVTNMNIKLMINHDMISHTSAPLSLATVDINRYTNSYAWAELATDMVSLYSVLTPYYGGNNSSGSDSYSFYQRGFNAVYFEERDFSPYYHSPNDIITNYSMPFCAEVIKSSGALLLTAVKMPSKIEDYYLYDTGTGTSLSLNWSPNIEPDFDHYKIYVGTASGVYDNTLTTTNTSFIINDLTEGTKYYVAVSAVNTDGQESFLIERNMTPYSIPLPPANLSALPQWHSVKLNWNTNAELDLAGYNIYRSEDTTDNFDKLNDQLLTDTLFADQSTVSGIKYYYYVKAQDTQLNESGKSNTVISRSVTLDKGILLVDATADGNGSLLNPTDEQVDDFYNSILSGFQKNDYDVISEGEVSLMQLSPYSTIIWQKDDNQNIVNSSEVIKAIKDYLDFGGNFVYTGFRPVRTFGGSSGGGTSYHPGSFLYDYLKIDSSLYKNAARFIGAIPLQTSYPDIFNDTAKTSPTLNYHLLGIEGIIPDQSASAIYKYDTQFDSTTSSGNMKGEPVGVEYIGADYKSIVLSFPLYYMEQNQAKQLIEYVLINKFNEVTSVEDDPVVNLPTDYMLYQNYPNPFNPVTKIKYSIPGVETRHASSVQLKVYDILGNEIAALVNEYKPAGSYEVEFDATSFSSGVYIYQLLITGAETGSGQGVVQTRKMILIR